MSKQFQDIHAGDAAVCNGVIVLIATDPLHPAGESRSCGRIRKLIEKDGQYVFVESMDPATRLLLERSYEKGIITQEERDKAIKESETRAYLMQPSFKLWYDRGFNFSMNDNAFLLKIRGRMQLRETTRWRNDAWRNPGDAKELSGTPWVSSATTVPTVRMILPRNSIYDGLGCCSSGTSSVQTSSTFFRLGLKPPRMRRRRDPPICWITMC